MSAFAESRSDILYLTGMDAHARDILAQYGMQVHRVQENIAVETFVITDDYNRQIARYSIKDEKIKVPNLQIAVGMVRMAFSMAETSTRSSYGLLTVDRFVQFAGELGYIAEIMDAQPSPTLCASAWALRVDPASNQPKRYFTWKECFQIVELYQDWRPAEIEQLLIHELHPRAIEGLREGIHPMVLAELYGRLP